MKFERNVFSQLHTFVLWALFSALFWSWIFTMTTDVPAAEKVTLYCYVPEISDTELAVRLEETKPEGIKKIKVHSFEYVMFDVEFIESGDLFIIPESMIEEYRELLIDPDSGVKIYDAASGSGSACGYIGYGGEDCYLFLGAHSVHIEDGCAKAVADALMSLG